MLLKKSHTRGKSDLGDVKKEVKPKFIAPDGGWGWVIAIASGLANLCIGEVWICFGLIFSDRFNQLGINASQTSTILNVNCAMMSCIGLTNGPLFKVYSYRQVCFAGALICSMATCALPFMTTFSGILIAFSIMHGAGAGLAMASGALAINTYFEKKRGLAHGLAWTIMGLGPMLCPQIVALLMPIYGSTGTCLLFGGFSFNAAACALLMQPVDSHARKESELGGIESAPGAKCIQSVADFGANERDIQISKLDNVVEGQKSTTYEFSNPTEGNGSTCDNEEVNELINDDEKSSPMCEKVATKNVKLPWHQRMLRAVIVFFDLDLLQDYVYLNLQLGINLAIFAEFNIMFLAPYIFFSYNLSENRVATAMSVMGGVDLATRIAAPLISTRMSLQSTTCYLIGNGIAVIGRFVLAHVKTYSVIITLAVILGIGRGLIIVYQCMIVPTHISLERLPAATGIMLMTGGLLFLLFGPVVGWIRDTSGNYTNVLYFLNILSCLTIVSWTLQAFCRSRKR